MYTSDRSANWFRAFVLGIGILAGLFFLRARLTRPEVPTPVSSTLRQYAPGVAIATTVDQSARHVYDLHWVDGVGFVGKPDAPPFDEVRMIPRRTKGGGLPNDRRAKIEFVQLIAHRPMDITPTMRQLAVAFDTTVFHEGCLDPVGDGYPYRQVKYFTTRHNLGGAALIDDWVVPRRPVNETPPRPWSLLPWSG